MKRQSLFAFIALVMGVAGCGKPVGSGRPETAAASGPVSGSGSHVEVTMREWAITVVPAKVPAGAITLKIRNDGKEPHGIFIEGPAIDRKAPRLEPGTTADLTLSLPPGEFNLTDFVKDNEFAHNMKASLNAQ